MSIPCAKEAPTRVICNPASGGGAWNPQKLRADLGNRKFDWLLTGGPGEAREAAREWRSGLLVVAGGDGTVNEVVQGLGSAGFPEGVTLALLPMGTGNDLARTLAVPDGSEGACEVVRAGRVRALDVVRVCSEGAGEKFFVNVAIGGVGAEVSAAADDERLKGRWGSLAYSRAFLEVARGQDVPRLKLTVDGEEHSIRAVNVAVGNCRRAGGGWPAAPNANPEDGLLDLVAVEGTGPLQLFALGKKVLAGGGYLRSEGVFFARGRSIRVETEPAGGFKFNADGELVGHDPAEFSVIPRALNVIVGPDYTPEPPEKATRRREFSSGLSPGRSRKKL